MRPGDQQPYVVRQPLNEGADLESVTAPQPQVIKQTADQVVTPTGPKSLLHLNKWAVMATTGILLLIVTIGVITLWSSGFRANTQSRQPASNYDNKNLSLNSLSSDALLQVTQATKLNINGELKVGNTFVLTPTATPSTPNVGQIYYNKETNTPYVYNGSTFVSLLDGPRIESVDGITGALTLGGGLQLIGNQLALSAAAQQSIGVRVTTIQGQSGDVIITGGTGISVNGTTISNTGITQVLGSNGLVIAQSGGLATVSLPQLLGVNDTPAFLSVQLNNALQISSGGTNTNGGSYVSGGVFYFNGTNFTTTPSPASNGLCLQSGPSGPIFGSCSGGSSVTSLNGASGALILDNATAVADHIVINDASSAAKGIASFNSTDFSVASGAVSLQNTVTKAGNTFNGNAQLLKLDPSGQATLTGQCLLSTASGVAFSNCPGGGDISSGTAQSVGSLTKFDAVTNKITDSIAAESPGKITVTGILAASYLQGDGSAVTNLDAAKVTTGTLSVAHGGTGQVSFVVNGLLLGNGTSGLTALAPGSENDCLVISGGVPVFTTCTGAGGVSKLNNATGILTLANASASGATITIDTADTAGTKGIASFNNTNFSVAGGVVNTAQNINTGANVQFASAVLTGTTALTIGQSSTNTGAIAFQNSTNGFSTTLLSGVPLGNLAFTLPSADGTTGQCLKTNASGVLSFGDCLSGSGAGGGVSSLQGTTDQISVSAATGAVTLSLPQNINTAANVEFSTAVLTGTNTLMLGTAGANAGSVGFKNGTNSFTTTVQSGTPSANLTFTLPSADGASGQCLTTNASGVLSFSSCLSGGAGGSGGVASLQGATGGSPLSGALSISNATSSGSAITIDDASATAKGIAQFTSTEFSIASGMVSLQNTVTKAGNAFNGVNQLVLLDGSGFLPALNGSQLTTLNATNVTSGTLAVAQGGTGAGSFTTNGVLYGNGTSIASTAAGTNGQCLVATTGSAPSFQTCTGAGGVSQLNTMTGAITIQNGTGIAVSNGVGTITISNSGVTSLQGDANQVSVSGSTGAITLSLPQNIHTGATVQFASATLTGASSLTVGQGSTNTGAIVFKNGLNNFTTLLQSGSPVADLAFTLPSADGTTGQCLKTNASGALSFGDCLTGASGGSGGVVSLQGGTGCSAVSGALTINNTTSSSNTIVIDDASATAKGIARFTTTDFSVSSGVVSIGTVSAAKGGTGLTSYSVGDLLYASSANTLSTLSAGALNSCLLSGGPSTAPSWGNCDGGAITGIGAYSATNTDSKGASIVSNQIVFQSASAAAPGMVDLGTQSFAGNKTFTGSTTVSANFTVQDASNASILSVKPSSKTITFGQASSTNNFTALGAPTTIPTGNGNDVAWSPDGTYLSMAIDTSPYIVIYKRSGDTFTKLPDPGTLPAGTAFGVAWSPDGTYMTVTHSTSPFMTIYKRSGDNFTKLADPVTLPSGTGQGVAWSPDGTYMTIGVNVSPFIITYKRSGDTFTKLANPAVLPPAVVRDVAWSPDGVYLSAATFNGSPYVVIYKRSGDTLTKLPDPAILPSTFAEGVAWSPDGVYLVVGHQISPRITIYKRSGDIFTKLADPALLPQGSVNNVAFSPDGAYLSFSSSTGGAFGVYSHTGDSFTKLNIATSNWPGGNTNDSAFSPDSQYMAIAGVASPYITVYRVGDMQATNVSINGLLAGSNASFSYLNVSGSSLVQGNLAVNGVTTLNDAVNFGGVATLTASGTALSVINNANIGGTLAVTGATTLTGQLNANGGIVTNNQNITVGTATVAGANINATTALQLGGVDINTVGTLSNVAYENQDNVFTGQTNKFNSTTATTQNALEVNANNLTTGSALKVTTTSSAISGGSLLEVSQSSAYAGTFASSNKLLNVSRNVTGPSSQPTLETTADGGGTGPLATSLSWTHTVGSGSNRALIVTLYTAAGSPSVTYTVGATVQTMTQIAAVSTDAPARKLSQWILVAPTTGTGTIAVTAGTGYIFGGSSSWTNVHQTTPYGTPASAYKAAFTTSQTLAVTATASQRVVDAFSFNDPTGTPGMPNPGIGQTQVFSTNGMIGSSYKTGASSMSWSWFSNSDSAMIATPINSSSAGTTDGTLSGSVANIASSCAGCTETGSILNLQQSNTGATGAVLSLQNSGLGADIQLGSGILRNATDSVAALSIQNSAGSETLFKADTTNNRIVIGNATGSGANTTTLVLDAAASDPTGVAGAMYYNTATNIFKCYTTGWFNCSGSGVSVVSGQGTNNTISKFSSGQLADSNLTDDGTTLKYGGKALIKAPVGSTGNLLDVQLNASSKFFVTTTGDTTIGGALTVGSIQSAAATALTLTANAASTWGTSAGKLTLQGGTGVDIKLPTLYNTDSTTFGLPTANTKNGELCVKYADATSNCTGLGGAVSSLGGTAGTIAVFTAPNTIANSKLTDDGSTLTYTNNNAGFTGNLLDIKVTTTSKLTVDQSGALTIGGRLTVNSGGIYTGSGAGTLRLANDGTLQSVKIDTAGASVTVNSTGTPGALVANSAGLVSLATTASSSLCLVSNGTTGAPSFQTCPSGPATVSVNDSGLNGALVWMPQSNGWGSYTLQLSTGNSYTAVSGDYLEYDVWCASGTNCNAGISNADAQLGTDQNNVANTAPDMNNISQADISSYATGKWYHRKVALTAGTNMSTLYLRWNIQGAGGATFYFKGIGITNSTTVKLRIYDGTKPSGTFALGGTGSRPCITSCGGGIEELRWASHDSIDVTNTSVFRGKLYVGCGSGISKCMSTASAGSGSAQTMATYLLNNNAAAALGVIGNGYATGSFTTNASPDIAETIDAAPDVETGDLVVPDPTHPERAIKSTRAYDTSVLGAISDGTGGFLINAYGNQRDYTEGSNGYTGKPLVIGGRIKIKVTTQNGVIRIGDPITTSDTPGYGMKATHAGNIVGYALDNLDADGMVLVYLNLTYYAPSAADTLQAQSATFGSLNISGLATITNLTVTGLATVHNLAIGGHIITTGGQPTNELQTASGSGATVAVDGTDTLGTITVTTGSAPAAGEMARIVFSEVYGKAPRVVLSASNDNAAGMRYYKGVTTTSGFMLNFKDVPQANTTYTFDYFIGE
jgi:hypothetical protein